LLAQVGDLPVKRIPLRLSVVGSPLVLSTHDKPCHYVTLLLAQVGDLPVKRIPLFYSVVGSPPGAQQGLRAAFNSTQNTVNTHASCILLPLRCTSQVGDLPVKRIPLRLSVVGSPLVLSKERVLLQDHLRHVHHAASFLQLAAPCRLATCQ
jgi:hypothetical protein